MRRFVVLALALTGCALSFSNEKGQEGKATSFLRTGPRKSACAIFEGAVCVCDHLSQAGAMKVEGGSVGVDKSFAAATGTHIDGNLVAYEGLAVAGDLNVIDDIISTGDVSGAGVLQTGGDIVAGGSLSFAGTVKTNLVRVRGSRAVAGTIVSKGVGEYVAPKNLPCDCADEKLLDVSAVVAAAKSNAKAIDTLSTTLSSGAYYFHGDVSEVGMQHLVIDGAVKLYVDGNIVTAGERRIEVRSGGTLDLYVAGSVTTAGAIVLGDPSRPSAFRMYVGGTDDMMVTAGAQAIYGMFYAPRARVVFAGATEVHGAIFAKDLTYAGTLHVVYDAPNKCDDDGDMGKDAGTKPDASEQPDSGNHEEDASSDAGTKPDAPSCLPQ